MDIDIEERNITVVHALRVYIPMDRQQALARGRPLPDRTSGAALFADISGFTPLTEALTRALGPLRGAEELTHQLDRVYDALVAEVDRYGGSVIGFAGDAITCWFADRDAGRETQEDGEPPACLSLPASLRATACALAMQQAMKQFSTVELISGETVSLAMKASVASGPARRFLVGNPDIQLIDALTGDTVVRMAAGEHLADRGEVLVDEYTATRLGEQSQIAAWRTDVDTGVRFAVLSRLTTSVEPTPWPSIPPQALPEEQMRSWLIPTVYERLRDGLGEFLLELRPGVALFMRFLGIDYEHDPDAGRKLDTFVRWVQEVVTRYDGSLLQLVIGDKGSYLYAIFGAPIAHEDDARRAVLSALELRSPPPEMDYIESVQIGVSQGTMRTGAYGGTTRRTYAALGDEVNMAARLMQSAGHGEVLVSKRVQKATADAFTWETLPPVRVKGKSEPVPVARLIRMSEAQVGTGSTAYTNPLVGRETELAQLVQFLQPIFEDKFAGMVYVYGEAGVGKSRLVYELRQKLLSSSSGRGAGSRRGVSWFTCPAEQILRQSLYPFKHFLRGYFGQYTDNSPEENKEWFEMILDALISDLQKQPDFSEGTESLLRELDRTRSFLGALVDLHWEGSLYEQLEPKLRFENTLAAFKTLIRAESRRQPVVLHVEDAHWLDADSCELLKVLTRDVGADPFVVLLTGRYQDDGSRFEIEVDRDVPRQSIDLNELSPAGIRALAAQILGEDRVGDDLAEFLAEKTNGNPLFVEQLTLDMRERGLVTMTDGEWHVESAGVEEVPESVSAVMIARLDRLAARVKAVVQTAAVLGREFEVQVLSRMLREDDNELLPKVRQAETERIWIPLTEMRYLFHHLLMRDAAYEMQLHSYLQKLHALAGEAIEQVYEADLEPHYADLAYHWGKAGDAAREFNYAKLAGERAMAQFANQEALDHFHHALASAEGLPPEEISERRQEIHLALGELLTTIGQYDHVSEHLEKALALAVERDDREGQARACRWTARMYELRGEYPLALEWIRRGLDALAGQETTEAAELSLIAGLIHTRQGDYDDALAQCQSAMRSAQKLHEATALARAYNLLGHISRLRGDSTEAIGHFEQALDLYKQAGHVRGEATTHNLIAYACLYTGQLRYGEQHGRLARDMFDKVGDVYNRAFADNNLGEILLKRGDLDGALTAYREALRALEHIGGSSYVLGALHNNLGATYIRRGDFAAAREHLRAAQDYFEQAQARDFLPEMHCHLAAAALLAGELSAAEEQSRQAVKLAREMEMRGEEGKALRVLGEITAAQGKLDLALEHLNRSLDLLQEVGDEYESARSQLSLARVHLDRGELDAGRAMLDRCLDVFQRLGAALDLEAARSLREELLDEM